MTFGDITGKNIAALIAAQKRSLKEIEDATSIPIAQLVAYENGEEVPSLIDFVKLCQYFGAAPQKLLENIPSLLNYASPQPSGMQLTESELEELQANFLKVEGPNRGDKFKNLIKNPTDPD